MSTIAILHPGELGSALGRHLAENGHRVVVTLEGRSERTRSLCRETGLEILPSLRHLADIAELAVAAVPPAASRAMAAEYAAVAAPGATRIYVDISSISPATARDIGAEIEAIGIQFVDGAIHGLASTLPSGASLFLSGPRARDVAAMIGRGLRVKVIGPSAGQASALKMFLSGMSKGMCALFLDMSVAAREQGCLTELLDACAHHYPEIMEVLRRLLPTYPRHARRRADEMEELAATLRSLGRQPRMATAARDIIHDLACSDLTRWPGGAGGRPWSIEEIIESTHRGA